MKIATLCYLKRDGQTLMLHRVTKPNDIHQDKWNGLGGKMIPGETPEEGLLREVHEESGLTLTEFQLRGILTFPEFSDGETWYCYLYTATDWTGEMLEESDEGILTWVDDEKLPELPVWEGDRLFFEWLKQPKLFSASFTYNKGDLVDHSVLFHDVICSGG